MMKSILHKDFVYTPAANTDIKKRFDKIRREQAAARKREGEELVKVFADKIPRIAHARRSA